MSARFSLDPARTAVLCMDYQAGIVSAYARDGGDMLARAAGLLKEARVRGAQVVYVRVGFRPGLPEVSTRNLLLGAVKSSARHQKLFEGELGEIHAAVAPEREDVVVTKHRVGAFVGTDLEMILRTKEIDTLVMFGIATSGVVLYTLLAAADADYRLFVIRDCCADLDGEVHSCLLDKVFPRQAAVVSADELLDALGRA